MATSRKYKTQILRKTLHQWLEPRGNLNFVTPKSLNSGITRPNMGRSSPRVPVTASKSILSLVRVMLFPHHLRAKPTSAPFTTPKTDSYTFSHLLLIHRLHMSKPFQNLSSPSITDLLCHTNSVPHPIHPGHSAHRVKAPNSGPLIIFC